MLKSDFTREQRFLCSRQSVAKMPKQMQADLRAKKIRFIDSDILHTSEISEAGGIYDLLRTTNEKEVGISDFDSNKLETGVNVAVGRIKIAYGKAPTEDGKKANQITYSSDITAFPTALLRAKLIFKQDNKTLLSLPVERFTVGAKSSKVQGEEDVLHLGTPMILIQQKTTHIQLEFNPNDGMDSGAHNHFFMVRTMGTETAAR